MPSKKKNTGSIDWDAINAKVKEFDRLHFSLGDINLKEYHNPTNIVTILDDYYRQLSLFFAEISKLFVTLENAIYREGNVGRNSLEEIQAILYQSVNSGKGSFKTTLGVETDVFKCRFIQKTVSEINNKNYLAKYLDEIISYEPNQLYEYNQSLLHSIKTIAKLFIFPQNSFEYISPKFEDLIVGHIPFFDDLKLIQECPQILWTEKIINKLEEINKTIISTGTFAKMPTEPEETVQELTINTDKGKLTENEDKKIKKSHLIRSLQFIFDEIGANNYDKTEIAKLVFFLLNGKEANSRSEYQPLLNAISSTNKQPTNKTRKKNEEILLSLLNNLNIKK